VSDSNRHKMLPMMDAFTSCFAPPEAPTYSDASDIYSLALSVHCMALLQPAPSNDRERVRREPLGGSGYSSTLARLMKRTLAMSVKDRPDALYLPYLVWREKQVSKKELGRNYERARVALPNWATE